MAVYDDQWTLSFENIGGSSGSGGIIIGNGKIGHITSMVCEKVCEKSYITVPFIKGNTNVIETFNSLNFTFKDYTPNPNNTNQSLNMYTAIHNTEIEYVGFSVSIDTYTPYHLPFSTVQTIRIIAGNADISNLQLYHTISFPCSLIQPTANNNIIYNKNTNTSTSILTCKANIDTDGNKIAMSIGYHSASPFSILGNTIDANSKNVLNIISIPFIEKNTTFAINLVNTCMSSYDYEYPEEESQTIVLKILETGMDATRSMHIKEWTNRWKTNVCIVPKSGISALEATNVNLCNRHLKFALYNIYSIVRKGIISDINSKFLNIIDITGIIINTSDLFFIPLLLLLDPELAKSLLEYRRNTLYAAQQLSSGYGFKGSKYPTPSDTIGYKNTLYFTVSSNFTIYNTALISINIWNYYRTSKDKYWLKKYGYPVLKENADFFSSIITVDECTRVYSIKDTVGLSGLLSAENNCFTNTVVKIALQYAIEASYELAFNICDEWFEYYWNLPLLVYSITDFPNDVSGEIYKFDSTFDIHGNKTLAIAEPLLTFIPYYTLSNDGRFKNVAVSGITHFDALKATLDAYINKITNVNDPINNTILCILYGMYSQTYPDYITNFMDYLFDYINNNVGVGWGNMGNLNVNNPCLSAMYIFIIIQGLANLKIYGGVAQTRFYYEELRVASLVGANMPRYWKSINITTGKQSFITQNSLLYL